MCVCVKSTCPCCPVCVWESVCEVYLSLLPSAEVSLLCVQEGDDYDVIPNSSFFVSRTAAKDNSSSYHINGKKATFKDVGILLRSHGIDLDHNRFLILQVIMSPLLKRCMLSSLLLASCVFWRVVNGLNRAKSTLGRYSSASWFSWGKVQTIICCSRVLRDSHTLN